jgi:hypothetical protein
MLIQNQHIPRLTRAALAGLFGAALTIGVAAGPAAAQEEDDTTLSSRKIMDTIMSAIGFQRPGMRPSINYSERSPLVIPPSRDLPPPEANAAERNPAWPVDPDNKRRKEATKQRPRSAAIGYDGVFDEQSRPVMPSELERGRVARTPRETPNDADKVESHRPAKPWELGTTGSIFNMKTMFGAKKEESVPFKGEPERSELTQPPPGYQTPSPAHPYGVGPVRPGPVIPEDRAARDVR